MEEDEKMEAEGSAS
jgi:poly [ADP-ribose] polymerase